jgi:signal transduction histidine kinase
MFRSLFAKLAAALSLVLVALAAIALLITSRTTEMYQQEVAQKLNRELASHIVDETQLLDQGRVNEAALHHLFDQLMVLNPSIEIYLLDKGGRILAYSAPTGRVIRDAIDMRPLHRYLGEPAVLPVYGDDPRNLGRQKVFSAARVRGQNGEEGYLYVILGGEQYDSVVQGLRESYSLKQMGQLLGLALALALVAGLALFHWLTRRLRHLSGAMQRFERDGALSAGKPHTGSGGDEIDHLSDTFHTMALRTQEQLRQLRVTDEQRRDLVANVSHDLRTPLATLQGCIETTLLKDSTLGRAQREEYLRVALRHCGRLNRLVQDLFELARLDAIEALPNTEAFPLAELVQDVAQKFGLESEQRGIRIDTDLSGSLPFVRADIGLVERVLENLVENALRHTPSGGLVHIALEPADHTICVRIRDTGSGIPEHELQRIFERFYQVDKSRSSDAATSGLGLAIVKRILELHGSPIEVDSAEGAGTTFGFALPKAAAAP